MNLKPEAVLDWITANGVEAAAWMYHKDPGGYALYSRGPAGITLTPLGGDVTKNLFVPMRVWTFIQKRVQVTPRGKPSMYVVA